MSNKLKKLILLGGGGHAKSAIDVINTTKSYEIIGILDPNLELGANILGCDIIGSDNQLEKIIRDASDKIFAIVTVGQIKTSKIRKSLFNILNNLEILSPPITSPYAYLSSSAIVNNGTMIFHGAVVNADAKIGANCIINSNSLIEHDAEIHSHCHISTGAIINGNAKVEEGCFIGSGSVIKHGVTIGSNSIIAMGQVVFEDVPKNSLVN